DMYRSVVDQMAGDALRASGDQPGAVRYYLDSLKFAESSMKRGQAASLVQFLRTSRILAEIAAANGNRAQALDYAHGALNAANQPGVAPRLVTPRVYAVVGFTHLALKDRTPAREWLEKSLTAWKQAQNDPGFGMVHQREMQEVEAALAKL